MLYQVKLVSTAARQLRKLPPDVRTRIVTALDLLGGTPRPPSATQLVNSDYWRVRVGDYRIVYEIDDDVLLVLVLRIAHRRDVYR